MEGLIEEQRGGRKPDDVYELNIDNCKEVSQISGLTDEYTNLETLTLSNNGLTSLKGFPKLPNLRKLDLSDNRLSDGIELLEGCPNLEYLNISGNSFKDVSCLAPLKNLPALHSLELFNCPLTEGDDYRKLVFELLEHVAFLDGTDRDGHPAPEDDDEDSEGEDGGSGDDDEGDSEDGGVGGHGDDDDEDEDGDEEGAGRGTKRKHEGDDEEDV